MPAWTSRPQGPPSHVNRIGIGHDRSATSVVVGLVSYAFFGLDALGDGIEEPSGTALNDLPLSALCRGLEIDLRDALGEADLSPPLRPEDYALL